MTSVSRSLTACQRNRAAAAMMVCGFLLTVGLATGLFLKFHDYSPKSTIEQDTLYATAQPTVMTNTLKLHTIVNAQERQAVCNDGSPAAYYFRPGSAANKDKWIIFFKGGGGCSSEDSCLARADQDVSLVSSLKYPTTSKEAGIFTANPSLNPDFYDWNMVKIMYCSSDNFIGNAEQTIGGDTWYFHGKAATKAVIEDLQNPEIIKTANLSQATDVLVAGSSAGGGGAVQNIDDIASWLPQAKVKGFIDSSWGLGLEPYSSTVIPEEDRVDLANFSNKQLDRSCLVANPKDNRPCTLLSALYPFIETPIFVFMNQYDHKKLEDVGIKAPIDEYERAWMNATFLPALLESYVQVPDGLFSPKQTFHTLLTSDEYFKTKITGITVQKAFTDWYFERGGSTRLVEE
jgi:O-palmitoleoyl-L-serine hydrolase